MNQIFLGHRAYGFCRRRKVYYGKALKDITVDEAAMLAGLPKRHPLSTPSATRNGHEQDSFTSLIACWRTASLINHGPGSERSPVRIRPTNPVERVRGDYAAEMVRQTVVAQYGEEAYTRGLNITTTIRSSEQQMAYRACVLA